MSHGVERHGYNYLAAWRPLNRPQSDDYNHLAATGFENWSTGRRKKMANSYSQIYYHIVFSTKHRKPLITSDIEERIWKYIGGIARKHSMAAKHVGGYDDHIHALVGATPVVSPSQIVQRIKGESSYWIRRTFPALKDFGWQDGYGMFSVSKSHIPRVVEYIKNQRVHHAKQSFEEEYVALLRLNEIEYDERYLFG